MQKLVILGAGPAGLAAALKLSSRAAPGPSICVLEESPHVGGMGASFSHRGLLFDFGSHRLHPSTAPDILAAIGALLGPDLRCRTRKGQIHLLNRRIGFPLSPADCLLNLPPAFLVRTAADLIRRPFRTAPRRDGVFSDELIHRMGETLCRSFYFPFAEKLWGLSPDRISADQIRRRISSKSLPHILGRGLGSSLKNRGKKRFYYPRRGFGQIFRAMARRIEERGGTILRSTPASEIRPRADGRFEVTPGPPGGSPPLVADTIVSTVPIYRLVSLVSGAPDSVRTAAASLRYRSMVLLYLVLETGQFSSYDCHYFPERPIVFSRMSEAKNYSGVSTPENRTGLCFEIPCRFGGRLWQATDGQLAEIVLQGLRRCRMHLKADISSVFTRRLSHAYPIYEIGYERHLSSAADYLDGFANLVRIGRQGLFLHDNVHHALEMGSMAADCVNADGTFDQNRWARFKRCIDRYTVED